MIKDLYREETNHDVYADFCCEDPAGSYTDEYVRWLEEKLSKLRQHDVSGRSELLVNFLLHLNDKELINNHDFDYEKEAKIYIKKIN